MAITPDTKDWTWVLERPCPECGIDVRLFPKEEMGSMVRSSAARWLLLLDHPAVGRRPSEDTWSALEYACHVRDVFRLYDERLQLMLEEDDPLYPNWDQDATALDQRYGEQEPSEVGAQLEEAATDLAARFDEIQGSGWERTGTRSDGARFTVETFARYLIHDPLHHEQDAERGYALLEGGEGRRI